MWSQELLLFVGDVALVLQFLQLLGDLGFHSGRWVSLQFLVCVVFHHSVQNLRNKVSPAGSRLFPRIL